VSRAWRQPGAGPSPQRHFSCHFSAPVHDQGCRHAPAFLCLVSPITLARSISIPTASANAERILDPLPSAVLAHPRQSSCERDDQRIYTADLICNESARLFQAPDNKLIARLLALAKELADSDIPY
jgi:hypothetical protein